MRPIENPNLKSGAYGNVHVSKEDRTATKTTGVFDGYGDDPDRYLMACNIREALFMNYLASNPMEGVIRVDSVQVNGGQILSRMEMGDTTLHNVIHYTCFKRRMDMFRSVFRDVLVGVCNMHRVGVVHGDIKPGNIVRVTDPRTRVQAFKLVDFGGICWYKDAPQHTSLCTYVTRAPELFEEECIATPISDAFSVGATMYYFLTRRYLVDDCVPEDEPSSVDTIEFVASQHESGIDTRFPKGVPKDVRRMIRKLLVKDPNDRMSCSECLVRFFGYVEAMRADPEGDPIRLGATRESIRCEKLGRLIPRDLLSDIKTVLHERKESGCLSVLLKYMQLASEEEEPGVVASAAHSIARALVYDRDTRENSLSEKAREIVLRMLERSGLQYPHLISPSPDPYAHAKPFVISIDGNIGASKSTVISRLTDRLGEVVTFMQEPVDDWCDILDMYYRDQSRWACTLHAQILTSFFQGIKSSNKTILMERSAWSCVKIFEDMLWNSGVVSEMEHRVICNMYEVMSDLVEPDVIVYLKCSPEVCYQRACNRGRECETSLTLEYLQSLHEQYERVMSGKKRVIIIDTSAKSPEEVEREVLSSVLDVLDIN